MRAARAAAGDGALAFYTQDVNHSRSAESNAGLVAAQCPVPNRSGDLPETRVGHKITV